MINDKTKIMKQLKEWYPMDDSFSIEKLIDAIGLQDTQLLLHPAKTKYYLASKSSTKTFVGCILILFRMENELYFNAYTFRKYKEQATKKLKKNLINAYKYLHQFHTFKFDYEFLQNKVQRTLSNKNKIANPTIEMTSFEDIDGTSGEAPGNGGYFGIAMIDEFIVIKDIINNTITDEEQFNDNNNTIDDSIGRWTKSYNLAEFKKSGIDPNQVMKWFYFGNPWGDHPICESVEQDIPEETWFKFIFGVYADELIGNALKIEKLFASKKFKERLLKNHTLYFYNKKEDILKVRRTKYANPIEVHGKALDNNISDLKIALIKADYNMLMKNVGIMGKPKLKAIMKVFNIKNYNETTLEGLIKDDWIINDINFGIDIDTSVYVQIAPAIRMRKKLDNKYIIFVDKLIQIPCNGTGVYGELNDKYAELMVQEIEKYCKSITPKGHNRIKYSITVDDNRKQYINIIMKDKPQHLITAQAAVKQGHYKIINRQDMIQNAFHEKILFISKENVLLKRDYNNCIKEDIHSPKRKTTSNTNVLDRIDAVDYALYKYRFDLKINIR